MHIKIKFKIRYNSNKISLQTNKNNTHTHTPHIPPYKNKKLKKHTQLIIKHKMD